MKSELQKLRKAVEKELDGKRFEHTLGVEYTAAALAMRYDEDVVKAQIAGLLHDIAKCMTDSERINICEKHDIPITKVERLNPGLLHSKVGAYLARTRYDIEDADILNAITNHTTGRPEMSLLEKITFIADYMEPGRRTAPHLKEIRKIAFLDLDQALLWILEDTLTYLEQTGAEIDPQTAETYDYYRSHIDVNTSLRDAVTKS